MWTRAPLLVGRDHQMATLEATLGDARCRRGAAVFVTGEAGIGKSRLVSETVGRALDSGMVVLSGRASTVGPTVPFRPLTEALLSLLRTGNSPTERELGPYRRVLGRLVPEWASPGTPQPGESLVVLAEAVLRLTSVVGQGRGCLLALEDLHDADVETLAVVEYLCDNLRHQSTALVATLRPEPTPAFDLSRAASGRKTGVTIELPRLGRNEIGDLAAACLSAPVDDIPRPVVDWLWDHSAGNPFIAEELLYGMVSGGQLQQQVDGWQVVGEFATEILAAIPATLTHSIAERVTRLGPQVEHLLSVAAVLGRRFPLAVVQRVTGMDDHTLIRNIRAAMAARLLVADPTSPDWCAFVHPLTVDALLGQFAPGRRAALAKAASDAAEALYPDLPGEWCQSVAKLRLDAGDPVAAARLFTSAGRSALSEGAAGSAVALLEEAERLLAGGADPAARAEALETLLPALAEVGQVDRAFELAKELEGSGFALDPLRRRSLHVRLAWIAQVAGKWDEGVAHVRAARALITDETPLAESAQIDAVDAFLALDTPGGNRLPEAEALARRVTDAPADEISPLTVCQAWYAAGVVARERNLDEAAACFERAGHVAQTHGLTIWRAYALIGLAGNAWLSEGDTGPLEQARQSALRIGAVTLAHNVEAIIALHAVLRGDYDNADRLTRQCLESVTRLRLDTVVRYALMARATLAAHQGRRRAMETELEAFRRAGGERFREQPLAVGLARGFCALLEEDRAAAEVELARVAASQAENPTTFYLAGTHGLGLLLDAVSGSSRLTCPDDLPAAGPTRMRWNRQFALLARAVLLGRTGAPEAATAAAEQAWQAAAPYPLSRHLAMRLVAESAYTDGWGDPVDWLRQAEGYFHRVEVPAVASACRAMLRRLGATVPQRRVGADRIAKQLRTQGVTVREYEVFELLAYRLGNKAIADRLHISPRTVEKHVASLIQKTMQQNRGALADYAASILTMPAASVR